MIYIRLKHWIGRLFSWLMEAKEFLACVLVIINTIVFSFYIYPSEGSIRISGYILQILGMVFAVAGILNIRVHFGHPRLFALVLEWLKRFPSWSNNIDFQGTTETLKLKSGRGRVELWVSDDPNAPLEERVSSIVRNLDKVREELKSNYFELNGIQNELKEVGERQDDSINRIEEKIGKDIELFHTKDVLETLVGLVWLTVGITFSTLPSELLSLVE